AEPAVLRVDVSALRTRLGRTPRIVEAHLLHEDDSYAANTLAEPERVGLRIAEAAIDGDVLEITLPPIAWVAVRVT
ncbi:hypothetical protein ACC848_37585, partial [Rhizobium johnstonii]